MQLGDTCRESAERAAHPRAPKKPLRPVSMEDLVAGQGARGFPRRFRGTPAEIRAAFMTYVEKLDTGCWAWRGAITNKGYGRASFGEQGRFVAHRVAYVLFKGHAPSNLLVMHSCDVPHCVNPDHLSLGTNRDNSLDAAVKLRLSHKLTPSAVRRIRKLWDEGCTCKEIGEEFGVHGGMVHLVATYQRWAHVI